jgi:hypothetical protein
LCTRDGTALKQGKLVCRPPEAQHDRSDDGHRKIAEPEPGEYAEPEEEEEDEDGETPEEPDVDPDKRSHRAGTVYLADRHGQPEEESEAEGNGNAGEKIREPVDEDWQNIHLAIPESLCGVAFSRKDSAGNCHSTADSGRR